MKHRKTNRLRSRQLSKWKNLVGMFWLCSVFFLLFLCCWMYDVVVCSLLLLFVLGMRRRSEFFLFLVLWKEGVFLGFLFYFWGHWELLRDGCVLVFYYCLGVRVNEKCWIFFVALSLWKKNATFCVYCNGFGLVSCFKLLLIVKGRNERFL